MARTLSFVPPAKPGKANSSSCVLIISNSTDVHSDEVEEELIRHGAQVVRLDTDVFFTRNNEISFCNPGSSGIKLNGHWYTLTDIHGVLYRRPEQVVIEGVTNTYQKAFAEKETTELLKQLYFTLTHKLWVSGYNSLEAARRKVPQLGVAKKYGLQTPKTVVTNSPHRVIDFFRQCSGKIIYKTLHAPIIKPNDSPELWSVPTTLITKKQLEHIELIGNTGGIFQEYIRKQYEVRVTIIGRQVFSAKIDSQSDPSAIIDWREAVACGRVLVTPYKLPAEIEKQCLEVIHDYGLNFGAIDLIRTPEGQYVFLELNCNGQWLWVEELTEQPLLESMVRLLLHGSNG